VLGFCGFNRFSGFKI